MISVEVADPAAQHIAAKLVDLAALRAALGDDEQPIETADRLGDDDLAALQKRLGVSIPESYRALARHVGTRGAGPDLGLLGPGIAMPTDDGGSDVTPEFQRPFLLENTWHSLEDDGGPRAALAERAHIYDGAMKLTELDDGCFSFLVLLGARAGEVWADLSAAGGPIRPLAPLLDWYEDWLDELLVDALVEAMRRAMPPGQLSPLDEILERWGHVLDQRANRATATGTAWAAQALWKLYQRRATQADELIARIEDLPPDRADELPAGMCEALTLWSLADDAASALDGHPDAERLSAHPSWRIRRLLAHNPATPEQALCALASDARLEVRCAVAANPGASVPVLTRSLTSALASWATVGATPDQRIEALFVLDLLARHPRCCSEQLRAFATWDRSWPEQREAAWVVRAVAYNPSAATDLISALAEHSHPCVREAVARRRDTAASILTALADDLDATVREAVAGNPSTEVAALPKLAEDAAERVRYRIAERADLPAAVQRKLACDFATSVLLALGEREQLDPSAAKLLALRPPIMLPGEADDIDHDGPYQVVEVRELAVPAFVPETAVPALDLEVFLHAGQRPPVDDPLLERRPGAALATIVSARAFSHPGYPSPLLTAQLAAASERDADLGGYAVAEHPWLELETMRSLAAASYAPTRAKLAARADLPADIVALLQDDPSALVQRKLAQRDEIPGTILECWATSDLAETRAAAAASPHAAGAVLAALASDAEPFVRRAVAANVRATDEWIAVLCDDPEPDVRRALTWRAGVSAAVLELLAHDADIDVQAWARWRQARDAALASR